MPAGNVTNVVVSCAGGRTIQGAFRTTSWPYGGNPNTVLAPQPVGTSVAALVGGFTGGDGYLRVPGTLNADGTFSIPNLPVGRYLLEVVTGGVPSWTEASADGVTLTYVTAARPDAVHATSATPVTLDITNLDPWNRWNGYVADIFEVYGLSSDVNGRLGGGAFPAGTTNSQWTGDWTALASLSNGLPDASKGDAVVFYQGHTSAIGSGASQAYVRRATKGFTTSSLTIQNGVASSLSVPLQPLATTASLTVDLRASQYAALAPSVSPLAVPGSVGADIFLTPRLAYPGTAQQVLGRPLWLNAPASIPDTVYASIPYSQFLGAGFPEVIQTGESYTVLVTAPSATVAADVGPMVGASIPNASPYTDVFAPVVGPVQAPLLNGQSAFSSRTGVGLHPQLSWSAPALGSPSSYGIAIREVGSDGAGNTVLTNVLSAKVFSTSFVVPSGRLAAGKTYLAVITANQATWDVVDADLWEQGAPQYWADCVTATFTP
jgi:hypothetical protein